MEEDNANIFDAFKRKWRMNTLTLSNWCSSMYTINSPLLQADSPQFINKQIKPKSDLIYTKSRFQNMSKYYFCFSNILYSFFVNDDIWHSCLVQRKSKKVLRGTNSRMISFITIIYWRKWETNQIFILKTLYMITFW